MRMKEFLYVVNCWTEEGRHKQWTVVHQSADHTAQKSAPFSQTQPSLIYTSLLPSIVRGQNCKGTQAPMISSVTQLHHFPPSLLMSGHLPRLVSSHAPAIVPRVYVSPGRTSPWWWRSSTLCVGTCVHRWTPGCRYVLPHRSVWWRAFDQSSERKCPGPPLAWRKRESMKVELLYVSWVELWEAPVFCAIDLFW